MRLAIPLVLVCASTAAADDRVEPDGAPADEVLRGNVLVWHDAAFYTEASDAATAVHVASLPDAADRAHAVGRVVPMHVVATKDAFVEVEAADVDCTWSRLTTSDDVAKLHLYVKRADLAPVLAKPFAKTWNDGTRVELRPGIAVAPTASGAYVLGLRAGAVAVDLPAASVAHSYTPDRAKQTPTMTDREYEIAADAAVTLGDRQVTLDRRRASAVERRGDTTLAMIEGRCATLAVAAPSKAVRATDEDDEGAPVSGGSGVGVLDMRDENYIAAGTVLTTPSGRQIAAVAKPIYLAAAPHGKLACVDRHVRLETIGGDASEPKDGGDKLRLCAPSSRVVHERYRHAGSNGGATSR